MYKESKANGSCRIIKSTTLHKEQEMVKICWKFNPTYLYLLVCTIDTYIKRADTIIGCDSKELFLYLEELLSYRKPYIRTDISIENWKYYIYTHRPSTKYLLETDVYVKRDAEIYYSISMYLINIINYIYSDTLCIIELVPFKLYIVNDMLLYNQLYSDISNTHIPIRNNQIYDIDTNNNLILVSMRKTIHNPFHLTDMYSNTKLFLLILHRLYREHNIKVPNVIVKYILMAMQDILPFAKQRVDYLKYLGDVHTSCFTCRLDTMTK